MTRLFFAAMTALALVFPAFAQTPPSGAQPGPDDRAKQWLTLVDDSNYSESTRQLAPQAKKAEIAAALPALREPLGAVSSRTLKDVKLPGTSPGMAPGQYAVVRYESSFARRANVLETVTLVLNKGAWSVVAYRID